MSMSDDYRTNIPLGNASPKVCETCSRLVNYRLIAELLGTCSRRPSIHQEADWPSAIPTHSFL